MSLHTSAAVKTLPPEGTITPKEGDVSGGKAMQISATYTDRGGTGIKSLTGGNVAVINSPVLSPADNTKLDGVSVMEFGSRKFATMSGTSGVIEFGNVNVSGLTSIEIGYGSQSPLTKGYIVEAFEGSVNGRKIGEVAIANTRAGQTGMAMIKSGSPVNVKGLAFRIRKADPAETVMMGITGFRLSR
jgi:cytochrome c